MRTTVRHHRSNSRRPVVKCARLLGCLLLACFFAVGQLPAQTPTASPQTRTAHKPPRRHARPTAKAHKGVKAIQAPATPPEPPKPDWPINNPAAPASIAWDSHGLSVKAANSSLQQILEDVATATGAKLDGTVADQRVFGVYGPGPARDILIQLLQGSGYNVLMLGDQHNGAPSRIVLTARGTAVSQPQSGQTAQNNSPEEEPAENEPEEPPQQPVPPPIIRPGIRPGEVQPQPPPNIHQLQQMQQMQRIYSQPNQ